MFWVIDHPLQKFHDRSLTFEPFIPVHGDSWVPTLLLCRPPPPPPPTRHGTLCSHWSDMMSVCFRSPWLGKLVLWNAVKMPVWTHHQTRHHCRQCRHAASGSTEIRSPGKKSTNAHVGIFAGLCNWRGEEKEGRAPRGCTHLQFGLLRVELQLPIFCERIFLKFPLSFILRNSAFFTVLSLRYP